MAGNAQTKAIGAALANYFVGLGMTQSQVAETYGISQSWVGRIYRGEFSARAASVSRMCGAAGIPFFHDASSGVEEEFPKYRLLRLLDSVWDGTDEGAYQLIAALLAIKKLRTPLDRARKRQRGHS